MPNQKNNPPDGGQDPIMAFVEKLLQAANLDSLPEEAKEGYKERLAVEVQRRLGILALQELDKRGLEEYQDLLVKDPKPNPLTLQMFFSQRVKNFREKMEEGMRKFSQEFVLASQK